MGCGTIHNDDNNIIIIITISMKYCNITITILDIIRRFEDWILSQSSGGAYSVATN
jgi:hypothetical protein